MRRIAALRRDQGLTLIELMVAMALTSLVALLTISLFISANNAVKTAQSIDGGTRQASNGMNQVARMIRAATPDPLANPTTGGPQTDPAIVSGSANAITFFAYVNLSSSSQSPVQATYSVNTNGQLVETLCPATTTVAGVNGHWDFSCTGVKSRVLCNSIPLTGQLFHYINAAGVEIAPPGTDATIRPTVRAVQIVLTISATGRGINPVTLSNTVGMPNLGFTNGTGP